MTNQDIGRRDIQGGEYSPQIFCHDLYCGHSENLVRFFYSSSIIRHDGRKFGYLINHSVPVSEPNSKSILENDGGSIFLSILKTLYINVEVFSIDFGKLLLTE